MQQIAISQITENLQILPADKLAVVYDFVSYLIERQNAKPMQEEFRRHFKAYWHPKPFCGVIGSNPKRMRHGQIYER